MLKRTIANGLLNSWRRAGELITLSIVLAITGLCIGLSGNPSKVNGTHSHISSGFVLGNNSDNVIKFVQLSDTHISHLDAKRLENFRKWVLNDIKFIDPSFTLLTGDVVDSKQKSSWLSAPKTQITEEWEAYKSTLIEANLWGSNRWIDVAGNHDVSGSVKYGDENDLRTQYMSWPPARTSDKVLDFEFSKDQTKLRFLLLNQANFPAVRFSYIGDASGSLPSQIREAFKTSDSYTHTFLGSHFCFPYQSGWTPFRKIIGSDGKSYTAHLCGHSHFPNMYARAGHNHLEAELNSFGFSESVRIAIVDNGLFTFVDWKMDFWPIVVVTNPMSAAWLTENDPLSLIQKSTHIRTFIFHNKEIVSVSSKIDGVSVCSEMIRSYLDSSMFTCKWSNKNLFSNGLHKIEVRVLDSDGKTFTRSHKFSLDGTPVKFHGLYSLFARLDMMQLLLSWLVVSVVISIGYLVIFPFISNCFLSLFLSLQELGELSDVLDDQVSTFDFFTSNNYHWNAKKKILVLLLLPFLSTSRKTIQLPFSYLVPVIILGVVPLILPAAIGDLGPPTFCFVMPWGWFYCSGTEAKMEMFILLGLSIYLSFIFPFALLSAGYLNKRVTQGNAKLLSFGDTFHFVVGLMVLISLLLLMIFSMGTVGLWSPIVLCGYILYIYTGFFIFNSIYKARKKQPTHISSPSIESTSSANTVCVLNVIGRNGSNH